MSDTDLRLEVFERLREPFTGESLFDCLADVVFFVKNARAQYVVVNRTLVERCGRRDKRELIGRTAEEVFPSPLGRSYTAQDEQVLHSGRSILDQLELHFYPTGRCGWCVTNKLPLLGRDGDVIGLYGVSKDLQVANERSEDFSPIAAAVQHMRAHFGEPLQVCELARDAGLSVYQFEQRIRRIFQVTAGQLIQKIRMEAAVARLLETNQSVADISSHCGYCDQSAFTRKFRETIGLSPLEYRRTFRQAASIGESAARVPSRRSARS